METSPLFFQPKEPWLIKSIVNGLIATVILWVFWTPFIIFLAVPLVNNQLKEGVCQGLQQGLNQGTVSGWIIDNVLFPLLKAKMITKKQFKSFLNTLNSTVLPGPSPDQVAQNLINNDPSEIEDTNWSLTMIMTVVSILITLVCIGLAVHLTQLQNLDGWAIAKFNMVMAGIIMFIEMAFFGGVAMEYMPFNPTSIAQDVGNQSVSQMNSILQPGNASSS